MGLSSVDGFLRRGLFADRFVNGEQLVENTAEQFQIKCVRAIGLRLRRIVMYFHEHAIDARRNRRPRQHGNELRLTTGNGGPLSARG